MLLFCSQQLCSTVNLAFDRGTSLFFDCDPPSLIEDATHPLHFHPKGLGGRLTITSPNFPDPYPANTLCRYGIPECPGPRGMYYISFTLENFQLETECDFGSLPDICTDLLQIVVTPSDINVPMQGGPEFTDPFNPTTLCGALGRTSFDTGSGPGPGVSEWSNISAYILFLSC